jgi:two-component system phosphate regulon sensor histidine kinase PhoR
MTVSATQLAKGNYDIEVRATTPDEVGALGRALGTLASELKARIGELTRERDRLSAILDGMVEGVVVIGWGRELVVVNPSAAALLESDEKIGSVLAEAIAKGDVARVEVESSDRSLVINVQRLPASGGAVAVLHDITALRQLEKLRRDFVANVSHELRTPVAAIQGYAETLLRGVDDKTRTEFLEVIDRNARRIGRLVEDLLQLAELEARPAEKAVREVVVLADVLAGVESVARDRLSARKMSLKSEIDRETKVIGDPDGLEQVFGNLIDNAIKYGREGGSILVRARRDGARVIVEIEDDGPGIAAEHLPRLFERFYRVDAGRSRAIGGSGLGLSIVQKLVESMGGSITVKSDLQKGTTMIVDLLGA